MVRSASIAITGWGADLRLDALAQFAVFDGALQGDAGIFMAALGEH